MKRRKEYSELTFVDDFMFCKVLTANKNLCKELLELILDIKISRIEAPQGQKPIEEKYDAKGIRLDVYVEDDNNTVFDLEMQTTEQKDLPKRTRYYQGMIDLNLIERGESYGSLKKSYVIFICLNDPFKQNKPIYSFSNTCREEPTLSLGDDAYKVIINAAGDRQGLTAGMIDFLDYILYQKANGAFSQKLDEAVNSAKKHEEWEVEYMTMNMMIKQEREESAIFERIATALDLGASKEKILDMLVHRFQLSKEDAEEKIQEYESENN